MAAGSAAVKQIQADLFFLPKTQKYYVEPVSVHKSAESKALLCWRCMTSNVTEVSTIASGRNISANRRVPTHWKITMFDEAPVMPLAPVEIRRRGRGRSLDVWHRVAPGCWPGVSAVSVPPARPAANYRSRLFLRVNEWAGRDVQMKAVLRWVLLVIAAGLCVAMLSLWSRWSYRSWAAPSKEHHARHAVPLPGVATAAQCTFDKTRWEPLAHHKHFPKLRFADAHVYAAHYDSRRHTVMIILDVALSQENMALRGLKCLMEFPYSVELVVVPAVNRYLYSPTSHISHVNEIYECSCPAETLGTVPRMVGLYEDSATDCAPSVIMPVHCSGSEQVQQAGAVEAPRSKVKFAVCTSPFSRNFSSATRLAEFVEVNSMFGAEKFTFYNYSASGSELLRLLGAYAQEGIAEVIPWPLYEGAEESITYFAQQAAFQDCLYRNLQRATYVAVLDLDEFIVPRKNGDNGKPWSWGDIVASSACDFTETRPGVIGSWQFRNTFYKLEWPDGNLYGSDSGSEAKRYGIQTLLKTWREKLIWKPNNRAKYFVLVSKADYLMVHTPILARGSDQCQVPIEEAMLQHYRDWGDPYHETDMLRKGVEDDFLARTRGSEIAANIGKRLKALGIS